MAIQDLYEKACDAIERANYDYAVELLREVLRQNPAFPDARVALRGTERRREQERGKRIGALIAMPFRMMLAAVLGTLSKPIKRLEVYEDFLKEYPSSFWGLMGAGAAACKAGYSDEGIRIYQDAQRLKPDNKSVLRALVNRLAEEQRSPEAVPYGERLLAISPKNRDLEREVRGLQASGHMKTSGMETAKSFRDVIRDKDGAEQMEREGRMVVAKSDMLAQVEKAEAALAEDPQHPTKILGLANLYLNTDQLAKARRLLLVKHKELPDSFDIRARLGDVQMIVYDQSIATARREGDEEKLAELQERRTRFAVKEFEWRHEQHPTDREVLTHLGKAYLDAKRYNEAIATFQEVVTDPRFGLTSARMLGQCFTAKGQYDLALEQYTRALKAHPDMDREGKELCYSLAETYEAMGNGEDALKTYKRIYSKDINFMDVSEKVDALGK